MKLSAPTTAQTTFDRRRNIPFPKTAIISITTHGSIELNGVKGDLGPDVIPQFTINPKITEFYKYNAVSPGVINFITGEDDIEIRDIERSNSKKIEQLFAENGDASKINSAIREILTKYPTDRTLALAKLPDILKTIKTVVAEQMEETIDEKKTEKTDLEKQRSQALAGKTDKETGKLIKFNEDNEDSLQMATEYINQFDSGQLIIDCITDNPQRKMVNKTYALQPDNHSSGEDWTISCLNFDFIKENIFDLIDGGLHGKHHIDRKITLEQLVNYLADNGVERLIIIDLTCCPFFTVDENGDQYEYIDGTARLLRRLIKNGMKYGGKRHTKKRRNTKRRKNTKRRNTKRRRN